MFLSVILNSLLTSESTPPPTNLPEQAPPYGDYGYPSMQPAYRQAPVTYSDSSPSHHLYSQSSHQQYSQVCPLCEYVNGPICLLFFCFLPVENQRGKLNVFSNDPDQIVSPSVSLLRPSQPFPNLSQLSAALGGLSGVPELEVEALKPINLLQERNLLPARPLEAPEPNLSSELKKVNCSPQYVHVDIQHLFSHLCLKLWYSCFRVELMWRSSAVVFL